jgi:5'-methylthioadenosine phosphorylase
MMNKPLLAVIGGSGLYDFAGLQAAQSVEIETPFGKPSAPVVVGKLDGLTIAFLARHGIGHHISPTEVNYRANIYALKSLGVDRVVSVSACGSLREDYAPGHLVVPDQIFDFTRDRKRSFFEEGLVAHLSTADPFCSDLSDKMGRALHATGATVHIGGTLITIEGPRFSTKAESKLYRAWGMAIIGMTASPEVFLAREAEMCYATMAHVTDYDVWHTSEEPVTVEMVIRVLNQNTQVAQDAIRTLLHLLAEEPSGPRSCSCGSALKDALITRPEVIPPATLEKLGLLVSKYLGK